MKRQVTLLPTQGFLLCEKDFESDKKNFPFANASAKMFEGVEINAMAFF